MNISDMIILALMRRYALGGYDLTGLEIQKLAYFLQVSGEPLKLKFEKGKFGPYAEQLHFVLQRLEGHCISGYGDWRRLDRKQRRGLRKNLRLRRDSPVCRP